MAFFGSNTIFQLFFSPLSRIPGPLRLRLTKLTHVCDMAPFENCEVLHDLRTRYGDVVRTSMPHTLGAFDAMNAVVVLGMNNIHKSFSYRSFSPSRSRDSCQFGRSAFDSCRTDATPSPSQVTLLERGPSFKSMAQNQPAAERHTMADSIT